MDIVAYKVLTGEQMAQLKREGRFSGAPIDLADGYVHLSTAAQLTETVDKHFAGQQGLWIAAVDLAAHGDAIKWEESRGGALFPHLYAPMLLETLIAYSPIERKDDGTVKLPVAG
ncbi:DUF952 domain-containing protein [Stakelama tenebrarum]|uniref:DUF952 domain-containing protein n=1 Tax=Stakelama tenebrarum TaxID=2711215 RepID=A0A6G6Y4S3_9SPHN|nr:DUF952 domain-containing protein [Sphingosinithalassobacter tenebrarum]QIG79915.1 DUF952 domain-containing protein [Sphingosinithalassobacter tenebrarum]